MGNKYVKSVTKVFVRQERVNTPKGVLSFYGVQGYSVGNLYQDVFRDIPTPRSESGETTFPKLLKS